MPDPMLEQIKRLVEVDGKLGEAKSEIGGGLLVPGRRTLSAARQIVQETIARIAEEHDRMARAREAAIELLVAVRDHKNQLSTPNSPIYQMGKGFRAACTKTIALLEGSAEEESSDD